jgi:large subunit ribosomal protein L35
MPKLKSKSGAKKRFRTTGTGKVRGNVAFKRHNLRKRSQKMKRTARGTFILAKGDADIVKQFLPYA